MTNYYKFQKEYPRNNTLITSQNIILDHQEKQDTHYENVINFYNDAMGYVMSLPSFHIGYDLATTKLLSLAQKHDFSSKDSLLEIGSGLGNSLIYLTQQFNFSSTGIDLNENQVGEIKRKIQENELLDSINVISTNILDYEGPCVDIIWSEDVFSHIDDRKALLSKCYSLLNKGGLFVFSDLIKTSSISESELLKQYQAWCLHPLETTSSYITSLNEAGFNILESQDHLGPMLTEYHNSYFKDEASLAEYETYLINNAESLKKDWGEAKFTASIERLKTLNMLLKNELDYAFFVVQRQT